MNHTPAQLKAIQAWTEQRDTILRDIGIYTTQLDELKKSTKAEALSCTDIQNQISECRGRLETLLALEERMRGSLSTDIAELEVRKTRLQGECSLMDASFEVKMQEYQLIVGATKNIESAHDTMKDQAAIVHSVVGEIIETSRVYISEMKVMMDSIRTVSADVIEKSNKNISQADLALNKLTMLVIDKQRPIPVRRTYPIDHPKREISQK